MTLIDEFRMLADDLHSVEGHNRYASALSKAADEIERLQSVIAGLHAHIEAMERQEPFDADSDVFRSSFEAALKAGNWPATRQGDGYRSPTTQIAWRIAFSTVNRLKLYLAPGAQPAPSIPDTHNDMVVGLDYQGAMSCARQRAKKEAELLYPEGDARKEEKERELASEYYRQYTTPNPEAKP